MASSLDDLTWLRGNIDVSDFDRKDPIAPVSRRTGRDPISAVKMPESLTAAVDMWAETRHLSRSDAIRELVELGLKVAPPALAPGHPLASDATKIEELAVHELEGLLDPALSGNDRERRIRRLTDGPPEFSHERIDLPKHRT